MLDSVLNFLNKKSDNEQQQVRMLKQRSRLGSSTFIQPNQAVTKFHDIFLYGQSMLILHKNKPKQMSVYLDHKRDKLLWVSSKTKAFILDLYYTKAGLRQISDLIKEGAELGNIKFCFSLKETNEEVIFLFISEQQRKKYFILFNIYSEQLKKADPNYSIFFSNINKLDALNSTQKGTHDSSLNQVLQISKKVGLRNQQQNMTILKSCMKYHKIKNQNQLTLECIDDYYSIQFCNRSLQPIFQKFSQEKIGDITQNPRAILKNVMDSNQFYKFLKQNQKQDQNRIKQILSQYPKSLSFFDFCRYLYDSNYNSISCPEQVDQTKPLKDYFCYSSHNTYLSGNQINSDCKAERYAEDLENGVKCVELDIHNDGGKPIVTHAINGKGLCKPVDFQDIIKVVDAYSQKCIIQEISHFPIILSLQNHASNENKEMMLDIMTKHFGKNLFYVQTNQKIFPSLSYLKNKIIIKSSSNQRQIRQFKKEKIQKSISSPQTILQLNSNWNRPSQTFQRQSLQKKYLDFLQFKSQVELKKYRFNSQISKIEQIFIPISSMAKFTTIFKSESGITHNQSQFACTSLETGAVSKKPKADLIRYTSNSWLRTYPHGTEVKSANYDPAEMLAVGAQIIALNTQTKDDYAWMMYRYFCAGSAVNLAQRGYVLKPQKLRNPQKFVNYKPKKYKLAIQLIQTLGYNVIIKFRGLKQDNLKNQSLFGGQNKKKAQFTFMYKDQGFVIFDIGLKYKDCVALRWIRQGYRVIEARCIENYADSGKRILVNIMMSQLDT